MNIITSPEEIQLQTSDWRLAGQKIALVPTMGCLHAGHLSLVKKARELGNKVVVSIFVNPIQFGPNEDFGAYPRQFEQDCGMLKVEDVDVVFSPEPAAMYPEGFQTTIRVNELSKNMCGADRPGHFDGVATVVSKLFLLCQPDFAMFGQKDFQQLAIINRLVKDLGFPVKIIGCPIVRETDGLAMSSRNKYLDPTMRKQALCLSQAIRAAEKIVAADGLGCSSVKILDEVKRIVAEAPGILDYAVIIDATTLQEVMQIRENTRIALAVKIGNKVRLIDNAKLM